MDHQEGSHGVIKEVELGSGHDPRFLSKSRYEVWRIPPMG